MREPDCQADAMSFNPSGVPANTGPFDALVVGASFGGPPAVEALLKALPADFPLPVGVVQHMTPGMTGSWAERLDAHCAIRVLEATSGARFEPGTAYLAPAGLQMRFSAGARSPFIRLDPDFADSLHVPSVDMMMSSAATAFGSRTLAVLLTGLGSDGACGMLAVRRAGGYTIGQDQASAVSYGMPGAAAGLGAVVEQLPLERIPARVIELGMTR